MRTRVSMIAAALIASSVHAAIAADRDRTGAQDTSSRSESREADDASERIPDNTARNARDGGDTGMEQDRALTAQDQSSGERAMELTRSIREKIVDRDDLSTYAKNVKIISDDQGAVTLRGPVRSDNERREIEQIARSVAGTGRVNNQLEVARGGEANDNEGEAHG